MGGGANPAPQIDPFAIASIAVSLFSLITCFCCGSLGGVIGTGIGGGTFGMLGIGLGAFSLMRQGKEPDRFTGKPLAIAGIAVGLVSILVTILLVVLTVAGMAVLPAR